MVKNYRELVVWQKAMDFVVDVYRITAKFPAGERFGLSDQLRRAAVSVPSNISEGFGRESTNDYIHFLIMARGSLNEISTQLEIAVRLGYMNSGTGLYSQSVEIGKLLNSMIKKLRLRSHSHSSPAPPPSSNP